MSETQCLDGFGNSPRFILIDGAGATGRDRTIVTPPRTDVAQDQKRGGAGIPTLPPIRTAAFLTNRVKLEAIDGLLDVEVVRTGPGFDAEPRRQAWPRVRAQGLDRNQTLG